MLKMSEVSVNKIKTFTSKVLDVGKRNIAKKKKEKDI